MGLFLPRKMSATCTAKRPRTAPSASMTCHLRSSKFTFGKYVFIQIPTKGRRRYQMSDSKSIARFRWISVGQMGQVPLPNGSGESRTNESTTNGLIALPEHDQRRIAVVAGVVYGFDQLTKYLRPPLAGSKARNASSLMASSSLCIGATRARRGACSAATTTFLAIVAAVALSSCFSRAIILKPARCWANFAFGMIFGGIAGNLTDRLLPSRQQVIDFLYFYVKHRAARRSASPPSTWPTAASASAWRWSFG